MKKWVVVSIGTFLLGYLVLSGAGATEENSAYSAYIDGPGPMTITVGTVTAYDEGPDPMTVTKA